MLPVLAIVNLQRVVKSDGSLFCVYIARVIIRTNIENNYSTNINIKRHRSLKLLCVDFDFGMIFIVHHVVLLFILLFIVHPVVCLY